MSITLRKLVAKDCLMISEAFAAQGWNKPADKYQQYLHEADEGARRVIVAEVDGSFAGYVTVVWTSEYPAFNEDRIPEITDLNTLINYRRKGVATKLLDRAELLIGERGKTAGIRVGADADYGPAQRLYVRRGYVPDGRGLSYRHRPVKWGDAVTVDDDLTLALIKELS